uniref:tryptophan 5-monooxygenase n=1 Tax=Macrostomum lignano TaxID=282301 RepID=A0A1I8G9W5_9PLAT
VAISEAANNLTSSVRKELNAGKVTSKKTPERSRTAAVVVSLPVSRWGEVFEAIQTANAAIEKVEFRSKKGENDTATAFDLFVQICLPEDTDTCSSSALQLLSSCGKEVRFLHDSQTLLQNSLTSVADNPWFPKSVADLDIVINRVLLLEQMNDVDHPALSRYILLKQSMQDEQYKTRRKMFAQLAFDYKHDQPIPLVDYTEEENRTWSIVFNRLCELYDKHACKEFLENFKELREIGLYRSDRIPQLRDVSDFVRRRSGFTLRPVAGYLSARDFLSALALRVFCCTQYIRHWEKPFYTPEPDCCHELLGHVPMLADPTFAHFSQEIGLASLGASEEDVKKLATCYFFTVEFGLCKEADQLKVYGAGLLSCVDELVHSLSEKSNVCEFEPELVVKQECRITTFQDGYFYTSSFTDAVTKIRKFFQSVERRHQLVYNPFTQSVETIASVADLCRLFERISFDLDVGQRMLKNQVNDGAYLELAGGAALRMAGSLRERLMLQSNSQLSEQTNSLRIVAHLPSDQWGDILQGIQDAGFSLIHLESHRSSQQNGCPTDLVVDVRPPSDHLEKDRAIHQLSNLGLKVLAFEDTKNTTSKAVKLDCDTDEEIWFPKRPADLDQVVGSVFQIEEQSIDHPSMQDEQYKTRRKMFAQLAFDYKHDQPIPLVDYTEEENRTWSIVFNRLCELYDKHACKEFLENFKELREIGLYRSDRIPQLRDVSDFVRRRSGFTLRPCYFFTVEFGFCKEAGHLKAYGAGLLACVDEFEHAVSDRAKICKFDPAIVLQQECKVTTFQDMYFFTNSFTEAKEKLRHFAKTLRRRQVLLYNPYTQSVDSATSASSEAVKHLLDRICWDLENAVQVAQELNH